MSSRPRGRRSPLGTRVRLEARLAVAWHVQAERADLALHRLGGVPVTAVGGPSAGAVAELVAQVAGQLGRQTPLEHRLDHLGQDGCSAAAPPAAPAPPAPSLAASPPPVVVAYRIEVRAQITDFTDVVVRTLSDPRLAGSRLQLRARRGRAVRHRAGRVGGGGPRVWPSARPASPAGAAVPVAGRAGAGDVAAEHRAGRLPTQPVAAAGGARARAARHDLPRRRRREQGRLADEHEPRCGQGGSAAPPDEQKQFARDVRVVGGPVTGVQWDCRASPERWRLQRPAQEEERW